MTRTKRWRALRLQALRRDGWRCVQCGKPGREVDHIKPVRSHPELAFVLDNLQTLDARCHTRKTRRDIGLPETDPRRDEWRALVSQTPLNQEQ
ncbi:HNH endonuclease [Reyranella soli]|uniref:HNH endonuclease n=1 Tax=Reyranella soli TaxID=1230389 RepID=UPI001C3F988F|nr:HNH endonuclease signature motif containing protein [Reyranella soli]